MKVAEYEKKRMNASKYVESKNRELDQNGFRAFGDGIRETEKRIRIVKTADE